jgi:hypothetical protein
MSREDMLELAQRVCDSLPQWMKDLDKQRRDAWDKEMEKAGCSYCVSKNRKECYCGK